MRFRRAPDAGLLPGDVFAPLPLDPATQSRKCFQVVEKAFWAGSGVAEWFATDLQEFQSAAWHKSGHPAQMSIKYKVAMDELVPKKLRDAGAGHVRLVSRLWSPNSGPQTTI